MRKITSKHQLEILQTHKSDFFCCSIQGSSHGVQGRCAARAVYKNRIVNCLLYEENTRKPYNDNLCLIRALALHLHGNGGLEEKTSEMFTLFLGKIGETNPASFQDVCMNDIPIVEDLVQVNIFLYDIDFDDGPMIGELARRKRKC